MRMLLFIVSMAFITAVAGGTMPSAVSAQSNQTPNLIDRNLDPKISEHQVDTVRSDVVLGRLTGVSDDVVYVNKSPFKLTPATTIVAEGGYRVSYLNFENDKMVQVKFEPDESTGGEGIPIAVSVRVFSESPQ